MVDPAGDVKVIDPEFTVFASPGLDAGSLLSGFVLAHLYRRLAHPTSTSLLEAIDRIWGSYASSLSSAGLSVPEIRRVEEDTVGFCLIEVLRTSLGFAGARDPAKRILAAGASPQAEADLERYQLTAVHLFATCVRKRRESGGGIAHLVSELRAADLHNLPFMVGDGAAAVSAMPPTPSATEAMATEAVATEAVTTEAKKGL
uniref:Uncharacterized protein n=1 Tax=Haptolina ericina TaxID=156174 RepID=A0A7S3BM76_9EUKA